MFLWPSRKYGGVSRWSIIGPKLFYNPRLTTMHRFIRKLTSEYPHAEGVNLDDNIITKHKYQWPKTRRLLIGFKNRFSSYLTELGRYQRFHVLRSDRTFYKKSTERPDALMCNARTLFRGMQSGRAPSFFRNSQFWPRVGPGQPPKRT